MLKSRLRKFVKSGCLTVVTSDGERMTFGDLKSRPRVTVRLDGAITALKLAARPDLYLGEAYMDGALVIEDGDLWDFLEVVGQNIAGDRARRRNFIMRSIKAAARYIEQQNSLRTARRNVAHHYDLSFDLYRSFLDEDLQYSCAYFARPDWSLETAQRAKKRHIISKLRLQRGQRVLDIGCGWGGLALSIAETESVHVTGITLSKEQLEVARRRARERGLQDRVSFELCDYRDLEGSFDRIVSVGMFEHVGTPNYRAFFDRISGLLSEEGIALIHSIGRSTGPDVTSAWIRKYIFPGGYIPAISEVAPIVENAGLWMTDLEILRLHYADTLRQWRQRFLSHIRTARHLYNDRFCRMWEFYLAVSEMSFRYGGMMVFQMQLTRSIDGVPVTRDYMFEEERRSLDLIAAE